jgi:hypothetical protein
MKGEKSLKVKGNITGIPMLNSLVWELGFFKSLKCLLMAISKVKSNRHPEIFMLLEIFEQGKLKSEVACSKHISFEGFK